MEKYRPKTLDEVIGNKSIVSKLKGFVIQKNMSNLLFVGKSGTGKTATAGALARDMGCVGVDFKELNASDDRGIDTVREIIKNYAMIKATSPVGFKIMLLDEADALTKQAQQALRRTMEVYSKSVRFILTGNDAGEISSALRDRCAEFQFRALIPAHMRDLLLRVEMAEKKLQSTEINDAIIEVSRGSGRRALNILESVLASTEPVTPQDIYETLGVVPETNVWELMGQALKGDIRSLNTSNALLAQGGSAEQILNAMYFSALKGGFGAMANDRNRLIILKALGTIPGSTEEQRLTAAIAKIVMEAQPNGN